jgi:hypothetical protein
LPRKRAIALTVQRGEFMSRLLRAVQLTLAVNQADMTISRAEAVIGIALSVVYKRSGGIGFAASLEILLHRDRLQGWLSDAELRH